ncbi:exopolysaccharide transport family protein [Mesorhizobium sp. CAU 1732]|uniref:exopolysaccharide transport family protein n=1 Tax=Mesorhizobium sp. CAU 1732 TaxID=3140358 RepID=UPI003260609D
MTGARPAVSDVDVDLGRLFGSLLRNWFRILLVAIVVTVAAVVLASLATPMYRAETRILIESREASSSVSDADRPLLDEEAITSQVEVIASTDILREVARKLNLAEHEEFGGSAEPSALRSFLVMAGLSNDPSRASRDDRVLKALRENLNVYRVDRSRVIDVRFSSSDPQLAAAVPEAVADAYLSFQEQAKRLSNADATRWLQPEIDDLRQRVRQAEARVAAYRGQSDLFVGQNNSVLATQQLSELSSELTRVRATRSAAEGRAEAIRAALQSGAAIDTVADVLNAPLVQRLRERQIQLTSDRADLATSLLGNHPRIRAINAQLAESESQLRTEMGKVLRSFESEASTAEAREQQLLTDLSRLKVESARAGEDEVELRALEREASAERALLESYLARYNEAASRADGTYLPVDARVFSRASVPFEAYFPKVLPIAIAAFVAALLVTAVIILLRELFSGRAMRPAEGAFIPVEQVVMPPVTALEGDGEEDDLRAASAPYEHNDHDLVAYGEDLDSDDALREIADEATPAPVMAERNELSIGAAAERLVATGAIRAIFVSPEGDEAAASSVMVARAVSDAGLRVLFLDLTSSGLASASMLESGRYPGITNLLASEAQFADIIRGDLYSDCHVIPMGTAETAKAMRAMDRLPIIMSSLTTAYDMVIVECGPTDADGISRVIGEGSEIFVSVIEPEDEAVGQTTANLSENGYENVLRVTPVGQEMPPAPAGRSVA